MKLWTSRARNEDKGAPARLDKGERSRVVFLLNNGQVVTTQLTTNCSAKATATFDLNDTTNVTFYSLQVPIWTCLVSIGIPEAVLTQSIIMAGITLVATRDSPFTITFNAMGSRLYTLSLDGNIIDAKTTYPFVGQSLGTFTRSPQAKLAMISLRSPKML